MICNNASSVQDLNLKCTKVLQKRITQQDKIPFYKELKYVHVFIYIYPGLGQNDLCVFYLRVLDDFMDIIECSQAWREGDGTEGEARILPGSVIFLRAGNRKFERNKRWSKNFFRSFCC